MSEYNDLTAEMQEIFKKAVVPVVTGTWVSLPEEEQQAVRDFVAECVTIGAVLRGKLDPVIWEAHAQGRLLNLKPIRAPRGSDEKKEKTFDPMALLAAARK